MKGIKQIIFLSIIVLGVYYLMTNQGFIEHSQSDLEKKEMLLEKKQHMEKANIRFPDDDPIKLIGKSADTLTNALGEPIRKDLSSYGYTWFTYLDEQTKYILFGIKNDEIVTVFAAGTEAKLGNLKIGQSYDEINNEYSFNNEVQYRKGISTYTFNLSEKDIKSQPLIKVAKDIFIQPYFDTQTETLTAIRLISGDDLLLHQAYELVYRGQLPSREDPSNENRKVIEAGQEQQIFELTNIIREMYNQPELTWENDVSKVAFSHSKDMSDNDYFSHDNLAGEGLTERLAVRNITYQEAGENIAANYSDALASVIGWLNSEGHRESLLYDGFTHLGVGVYDLYYTQNFLKR